MGVPLVLVSLAVPVGMLAPADPTILVGEIPLDPFVLFLLPPLLSSWRWVTVALAVAVGLMVTVLPRLLRRRDPEVISVIDDACTGCELCVADCPYDALHMIDRHTGRTAAVATRTPEDGTGATDGDRRHLLAVVDADRCVGCGSASVPVRSAPSTCRERSPHRPWRRPAFLWSWSATGTSTGSTAPAARPSSPPVPLGSLPTGRAIGRCCTRSAAPEHWHPAPSAASASSVPPSSSWSVVPRTTVATGSATPWPPSGCGGADGPTHRPLRQAGHPGLGGRRSGRWGPGPPREHPELDTGRPPARREALVGVAVVALATVVGLAFATRAPFGRPSEDGALRVVIDHEAGRVLAIDPDKQPIGAIERVEVRLAPADGRRSLRSSADRPGRRPGRRSSTSPSPPPAGLDNGGPRPRPS